MGAVSSELVYERDNEKSMSIILRYIVCFSDNSGVN